MAVFSLSHGSESIGILAKAVHILRFQEKIGERMLILGGHFGLSFEND